MSFIICRFPNFRAKQKKRARDRLVKKRYLRDGLVGTKMEAEHTFEIERRIPEINI